MADSFVQVPVDSTGKKLQTFNNTVGANSVHSEATTLTRSSDNTEIGTASQPVRTDPTGTTAQPVTGTFFQSTQPVSVADGLDTTLGAKADAKSAATDTTAISAMSVLKQISASVQAPPSQAVTNAGTFAVQAQPVGNGAILSNQQAVTGSAVALASNACRKALIKALVANTINVYVGPSGITTGTGYELGPGEAVALDITNTNLVFVIASTTGASVSWIATN